MELKREIFFSPAFDKRDPDPDKNYGIHGVDLRFFLTGPKGVIQFIVHTGWMLPHVAKELRKDNREGLYPMAADIGYHSPVPMYEGQTICCKKCEYLNGKPCYYDGSSLGAQRYLNALINGGSDKVWKMMEKEYIGRFGEE